VIVMDLEMPGTGGLAAAHRMKKVAPAAKVLILSAYDDESKVLRVKTEVPTDVSICHCPPKLTSRGVDRQWQLPAVTYPRKPTS
jgi:DNA-binding NarL/FixJ family response regulator